MASVVIGLYLNMKTALNTPSKVMSTPIARTMILLAVVLLARMVVAQDVFQHILTTGFEDMAEIKRKAEAGDARSQFKLANSLATQMHWADALQWYSKAARQGDLESFYRVGHMLLYGAFGTPPAQAVPAKPAEGIFIIFRAATNGHHDASYDMYKAYKEGRGVAKDTLQAYAWLQLNVDTDRTTFLPAVHRAELNGLAMDVDVATSQEGKRLAALYRSGNWPKLVVQIAPEPKPVPPEPKTVAVAPKAPAIPAPHPAPKPTAVLKLKSIAMGPNPIAMINGKLLGVGETATVTNKGATFAIKCLRIEPDSVLVSVEGEPEPRQLQFR